jgi:hypothetical protein
MSLEPQYEQRCESLLCLIGSRYLRSHCGPVGKAMGMGRSDRAREVVVGAAGFEPARPCGQRILSPRRLPVTPRPRAELPSDAQVYDRWRGARAAQKRYDSPSRKWLVLNVVSAAVWVLNALISSDGDTCVKRYSAKITQFDSTR